MFEHTEQFKLFLTFLEEKQVNNTDCLEMSADQSKKVGKHWNDAAKCRDTI